MLQTKEQYHASLFEPIFNETWVRVTAMCFQWLDKTCCLRYCIADVLLFLLSLVIYLCCGIGCTVLKKLV